MAQPARLQVVLVHEDDVAPAADAAIAIVEAVDGRIVLIVAADGGEHQRFGLPGARIAVEAREHDEVGLAVRRQPLALGGGDVEAEAARLAHARIEVGEGREDLLDGVADDVVIGDEAVPIDLGVRQGRLGDAGDDGGLGFQIG